MLFWWGLALCGLGAGGSWVVVFGAVSMVLLFVLASIPMKDKRMAASRPAFAEYRARVPALIPGLW
jgi:steroid 5-alpha reductase family enzyme